MNHWYSDAMRQWIQEHQQVVIVAVLWVLVISIGRWYMSAQQLTFVGLSEELIVFLKDTPFGAPLYVVFYLVRSLILFPASLITIIGGAVFGLKLGFFLVWIGGTASALIPYFVGKYFSVSEKSLKIPALNTFVSEIKQNPLQAVLTMRLLYLPYDPVSILAGSLGVPLKTFLLGTLLGNIIGTFVYVSIGSSLEGTTSLTEISFDPKVFAVSIICLVISVAIIRLLKKRKLSHDKTDI